MAITTALGGFLNLVGSQGGVEPNPDGSGVAMPQLLDGWGRYIFLDGDNGNDEHVGFIDAPLGTVFTPSQAAAVAIRTTDRLEEITPMFGNGQAVIRLWKPRAGRALYDRAAPGDGLGRCDRRQLRDYRIFVDRGSDHTNSADDSVILGAVTVGSPYTVAGAVGNTWELTGAVFADPFALSQYRVRLDRLAGGTLYAAARYGDPTDATTDKLNVHQLAGPPPVAGDTVTLQIPGVRVFQYFEQAGEVPGYPPDTATPLGAAGLAVAERFYLGCGAVGAGAFYSFVVAEALASMVGKVRASNNWLTETNSLASFSNPGLAATNGLYASGPPLDGEFVYGQIRGTEAGGVLMICDRLVLNQVVLDGMTGGNGSNIRGCANGLTLLSCVYGALDVQPQGYAELRSCRHAGVSGQLYLQEDTGFQDRGAQTASLMLNDLRELSGTPTANPGVVMNRSRLKVAIQIGTCNVGTGVDLRFDENDPPTSLLVPWTSLNLSGFELIGGQKIVVMGADAGLFTDGLLPCPRAKLMRFVDFEGVDPVTFPTGSIVGANSGRLVPLALASPAGASTPPIGFLAAPSTTTSDGEGGQLGGPALVVTEDAGMIQYETADDLVAPEPGDSLFLSEALDGAATKTPPARGPWFIGRVLPTGYDAASQWFFCSWLPSPLASQLGQSTTDLEKDNTSRTNIPGCVVHLKAGRTYQLRAMVNVQSELAGGSKIALVSSVGIDVGSIAYTYIQITGAVLGFFGGSLTWGDPTNVLEVSATNGFWFIEATVKTTSAGDVSIGFAQQTASGTSTAKAGSYLSAMEQA